MKINEIIIHGDKLDESKLTEIKGGAELMANTNKALITCDCSGDGDNSNGGLWCSCDGDISQPTEPIPQ